MQVPTVRRAAYFRLVERSQRGEVRKTPKEYTEKNVNLVWNTTASNLRVAWANSLRWDKLLIYLGEFGLDINGTVQEIRRRCAQFIGSVHKRDIADLLLELQAEHETLTLLFLIKD